MKKYILLTVLLASIMVLLVSCSSGVPQDQYKKATDDLAAAQTQVQSLQTQIQSLQSQIQASQSDKTTLTDLQNKLSQTKSYWELFTTFYQLGTTGQTPNAAQIMDMMSKIQAINDPVLTGKWQATIDSSGGEKESLDFVNYLITKVSDLLK